MHKFTYRIFLLIILACSLNTYAMEYTTDYYYNILGVERDATGEEITNKFNAFYYEVYPQLLPKKNETKTEAEFRNKFILPQFRKKVIAYIILSDQLKRGLYDENYANVEEPYHFYSVFNIPLEIPKNSNGLELPPDWINPSKAAEFFTKIKLESISRAYLNSRGDNDESATTNIYLTLTDPRLREFYHDHPTKSAFEDALITSRKIFEEIVRQEIEIEKAEKREREKNKSKKNSSSFRKSVKSPLTSLKAKFKKEKSNTLDK